MIDLYIIQNGVAVPNNIGGNYPLSNFLANPFLCCCRFCFASTESFFRSSFYVAYVIANLSMVTINSNESQATNKFSADTRKMILYDIYFLEQGKEI